MLGIVIGVSAVIALVSFGQSFQAFVNQTFQSLGSNLVFAMSRPPGGTNAKNLKIKPLTMEDAEAIANPILVPGIQVVVAQYDVLAKVVVEGNSLNMNVSGVGQTWSQVREWGVTDGRFLEQADIDNAAPVAVLGAGTADDLFGTRKDLSGEILRINNIPFRVIGVLEAKDSFGGMADQLLIVPITTAQTRLSGESARTASGSYRVSYIMAKTMTNGNQRSVKAQMEQVLSERHKIQFIGEEDFVVIGQDQILDAVDSVLGLLTIFLALIAGISLLVGGIGVMNIMLVSVTERTREIGLRKAVGARYIDLMLQFLFESVAVSVSGGLVGILIGALMALIGGLLLPTLGLTITPISVVLAVGVSVTIGIFFGIYPASRAAALNPIEALRYE
jgi:putative ABC transport system permease protein